MVNKDVEASLHRRIRLYKTFRWVSLILIVFGFVVFLLGILLNWNVWIYPWFGGGLILIALILPFTVRRVLKIKDPDMVKFLVLGIDYRS